MNQVIADWTNWSQLMCLGRGPRLFITLSQRRPKSKGLESARQEEASICTAAYFTWLASSHRMAARSNSVNEVTPNLSFARAQ